MLPYSILPESLKYEAIPNSIEHAQLLNAIQVNRSLSLIIFMTLTCFSFECHNNHREFTEHDLAQVHSK